MYVIRYYYKGEGYYIHEQRDYECYNTYGVSDTDRILMWLDTYDRVEVWGSCDVYCSLYVVFFSIGKDIYCMLENIDMYNEKLVEEINILRG